MSLLEAISLETGLSIPDVERIIRTAPARYKHYEIAKRHGGFRLIAQPSRELKVLQRFLLESWLGTLPVHSSAMAYVKKRNIYDNAHAHRSARSLLKLDFENFFPSIRVRDWRNYSKDYPAPWSGDGDAARIVRILFWGQRSQTPTCLSIGAPTSPMISNLLMFDLDREFYDKACEQGLVYTRYADDITVSGSTVKQLLEFEAFVRQRLKRTKSPKLKVNESKRGVFTPGRKQMVTGLIVTPTQAVSIGRERKRMISAMIHKFTLQQLSVAQVGYLKGMLGFAIANEPAILSRMRAKYGDDIVNQILRARIPKRLA
jgi:RNA-directed DNA polymerase